MDQQQAFDEINRMLLDTDYPYKIKSIGDIEEFLLDETNRRFEDQYPTIGRIYDDLRGRSEIDRTSNQRVIKEEEQQKNQILES